MKLKTFGLSFGETVNIGNFNNVKYEVSGTIELDADCSHEEQGIQVTALREYLKDKARAIRASIKDGQG